MTASTDDKTRRKPGRNDHPPVVSGQNSDDRLTTNQFGTPTGKPGGK